MVKCVEMQDISLDVHQPFRNFLKSKNNSKFKTFYLKFPHGVMACISQPITIISERTDNVVNGISMKSLAQRC